MRQLQLTVTWKSAVVEKFPMTDNRTGLNTYSRTKIAFYTYWLMDIVLQFFLKDI